MPEAGASSLIRVRIDAAGDCTNIMRTIEERAAPFTIKAKTTADLCAALSRVPRACWRTVDVDTDGKPSREVAEVTFARGECTTQASTSGSSQSARRSALASTRTCLMPRFRSQGPRPHDHPAQIWRESPASASLHCRQRAARPGDFVFQ
jgi:hypothetical protein